MQTKPQYIMNVVHPGEIDTRTISAWADLEARAVEPNAFLSPYFVMPAIKYLEPKSGAFGVFIKKNHATPELVGVAFFTIEKPIRKFPLIHLRAFESIHTGLSGFLIDKEYESEALAMLYGFITNPKHRWHGLYIDNCPPESLLSEEAKNTAGNFGMEWVTINAWQRAILRPSDCDGAELSSIPKGLKKDYQRRVRGLKSLGDLKWRLLRGAEITDKTVDELIRLEHMGWKGEKGTSLYSDVNQLNFFKEMVDGFKKDNRILINELSLDGKIIAASLELVSGRVGFGLKMGWDPGYAKYAPGITNLIQTMENAKDLPADLEFIDSLADPESYINSIWHRRRMLVEGVFVHTPLEKMVVKSVQVARKAKRALSRTSSSKKLPQATNE